MDMELKAQQALAKVRDMYAKGQWTQGDFSSWAMDNEDITVLFCPVGGIRYALTGEEQPADLWEDELAASQPYWQALTALAMEINPEETAVIINEVPGDTDPISLALSMIALEGVITVWNDSSERQLDEVLGILDQALAKT